MSAKPLAPDVRSAVERAALRALMRRHGGRWVTSNTKPKAAV